MDDHNAIILRPQEAAALDEDENEVVERRACRRCNGAVPVTRKMRKDLEKYGGVVAHAICPEERDRIAMEERTFSVEVRIGADLDDEPHEPEESARVETLGWFRATAVGATLADAMPELARELSSRWDKATEHVHVMDPGPVL